MQAPAPSGQRRAWPVVTVLAGVIVLQVLLAVASIDVMSSVRAYVTGESLYSKGQKDAHLHLLSYAASHRREDYALFQQALAVPLGDRRAREALQQSPPDVVAARRGFLDGANHPDDIDGLIRLFVWFQHLPFMAEPIATWTQGDHLIEQTRILAERAHQRLEAGQADTPEVREMRELAPQLNQRLTSLERDFSDQLGAASRQVKLLLLGMNLALAAVLAGASLQFVRHNLRARESAEAEVRRRQESLQLLLDSAAEGLYGVDTDGRCTFINRSALRMLGYEREADLVGQRIHDLIHHTHADGRPYPAHACRMYLAHRSGEPVHVNDEVFWRRDGSAFQVEYWSHPVLRDGQIRGAVATFFDITERLRTQAALHGSQQRLARLVDSVADGVVSVDPERRILLINRAAEQMFGVVASKVLGRPVEQLIAPHAHTHLQLLMTSAFEASRLGRPLPGLHELQGIGVGGEEFPVEASLSVMDAEQGRQLTIVLRDMSHQQAMRAEREAREALEASHRARSEFLSRMSHELRTPLNAVLGFAQLLRMDRRHPLTPEQSVQVQHIEHAGTHLLALVNDVLDLSRVESGSMSMSLEAVDAHAVAEEAVAFVSPLAAGAGVEVLKGFAPCNPADRSAWVVADRVRLRQVLVNLLSNAVKYNRQGGRVRVDYADQGGAITYTVADDGAGMTPEQLAHLFEPFNRLGAERTAIEGSGIGLVLSRHLVGLMRGSLTIDSAAGQGTLATVQLQRASRPAVQAPPPYMASEHSALDGGSLSVLYAEDNEVNVEIVRQVAAFRPAVRLRVAHSGAAALAMARAEPPELMLVDMHLGDMTGLELAQALRAEPATSGVHLVALSADALPEQISAALDFGFEGYLTKPISFRELLRVLDGYIAA